MGSMHTLSVQFRLLLVDPIEGVLDPPIKTYVVVIDALDECTKVVTVEKLVQAVVDFAPDIPLKFFISSRDTTQIRSAFHHNSTLRPKIVSLHSIERGVVQEDIKLYLKTSLSVIVQKNLQPIPWPPPIELEILLQRSDGLFIYAATALRYLGVPDVDFRKRLTHITRLTPSRLKPGVIDSLITRSCGRPSTVDLDLTKCLRDVTHCLPPCFCWSPCLWTPLHICRARAVFRLELPWHHFTP